MLYLEIFYLESEVLLAVISHLAQVSKNIALNKNVMSFCYQNI